MFSSLKKRNLEDEDEDENDYSKKEKTCDSITTKYGDTGIISFTDVGGSSCVQLCVETSVSTVADQGTVSSSPEKMIVEKSKKSGKDTDSKKPCGMNGCTTITHKSLCNFHERKKILHQSLSFSNVIDTAEVLTLSGTCSFDLKETEQGAMLLVDASKNNKLCSFDDCQQLKMKKKHFCEGHLLVGVTNMGDRYKICKNFDTETGCTKYVKYCCACVSSTSVDTCNKVRSNLYCNFCFTHLPVYLRCSGNAIYSIEKCVSYSK